MSKRKENGNGDHATPDSTTRERAFSIGDEVLMQRKDGNFYLGTVVKIDLSRDQCQVKFGDNTETWSSFSRLNKLSQGLEVMCVKCKKSHTEADNDIVICDNCSRGYHQKCHFPNIGDDFFKDYEKWECLRCTGPERKNLPLRKSVSGPPQPPPPHPSPAQEPPKPSSAKVSSHPKPPPAAPLQPKLATHSQSKASPPLQPKTVQTPTPASSVPTKPAPSPVTKTVPSPQPKPTTPPQTKPTVSTQMNPASQSKPLPPQVSKPVEKPVQSQLVKVPPSQQVKTAVTSQAKPSPTSAQVKPSTSQEKQEPSHQAKPTASSQQKPVSPPQAKSPPSTQVKPGPSQAKTDVLPLLSKPVSPSPNKLSLSSKQLCSQDEPLKQETIPESSPPTPPATPIPSVSSALPVASEVQKKKLPYNLNELHWDMQHRTNTENKYCYCGGPGKWFLKMLQCGRCRQWFHGRCLSSLRYPLFYGDRFYVFLCTHCNSGKEFLRRLEIKWIDLVHLATFNLTLKTAKKYQDVDDDILHFINSNWNDLQLPPKIFETSDDTKRENILSVLTGNRNRFKGTREVKSRKTKWGLRVRVPPPTPVFSLPPNKPLSDQVLSDAWNNSARLKFLPPPPRNAIIQKSEDDFDLNNLKETLPGVEILHIDTRMLVLPKGVPTNGQVSVCIKSSTPMYPESRAIKRRIKEQGMETSMLRRQRKARRLLRSSLKSEGKERQDLPPTPPSSESNPEVAPAQHDTSGDETSSRGTLDLIIPRPVDFEGRNNPFLPASAPVLRPIKRRLSEKDIIVTSTGEVKRRKVRRSTKLARAAEANARAKLRNTNKPPTPTTSPVKPQPNQSLEQLKTSVNQYFGAINRIASGEKFSVRGKRITLDGKTQYLINWGTPT